MLEGGSHRQIGVPTEEREIIRDWGGLLEGGSHRQIGVPTEEGEIIRDRELVRGRVS